MKARFCILLMACIVFLNPVYGAENTTLSKTQAAPNEATKIKQTIQSLQVEIAHLKQRVVALEKQLPVSEWQAKNGTLFIYTQVEPFMVNPAGKNDLRIASIHIHLALSSEAVKKSIAQRNLGSKIRSSVIEFFSSKTIEQTRAEHHIKIKQELRDILNAFLGKDAVLDIYFQNLVIQ